MLIKQQLVTHLTKVLKGVGIVDIVPTVAYPADPAHGDYATNVALIAAKQLGKKPRELAEVIKEKLSGDGSPFSIHIAGPGFINFRVKDECLLMLIDSQQIPNNGEGKTIVVEYSSPNIAKPFTIGHLRSTIIGDAVANLLEATGWQVKRDNHVGDWGTQFGKQIYAIKAWGNEDELNRSEHPVKLLVALYVKFHEEAETNPELEDKARAWFRKLEDGDSEAQRLWQKCIDWSWKEFEKIYHELWVPSAKDAVFENNNHGYGESFFEDKMDEVITELRKKSLLSEGKEGAQIVHFAESTKLPPLMILKKDGATLYATRDLATDKFRLKEYGKGVIIINEVGAEQSLYFQQLYTLEEMLGWFKKEQRVHIKHGLYRFKEGKMSTRKGNVIWLEDVLAEAKKQALFLKAERQGIATKLTAATNKERTSEQKRSGVISAKDHFENINVIAIGALKWNDLKRSPEQDITFDWQEILTMQGNSGPYIQYTYARTQSVLAKAEGESKKELHPSAIIFQPEERELLILLSRFPEIIEAAAIRYAPNMLCTYLFELAQAFNAFYQKHQIVKAEKDVAVFRLRLTYSVGKILHSGLSLLGIQAPEQM